MATPVPVQSAPTTRAICRESDHLSTKTEFHTAAELRAEFDSIHNSLEASASSAKKLIDEEIIPGLTRMQALLSQRGAEHDRLLREADLPTWVKYYEDFRQRFSGLKSLRTFQRRQLAGGSAKSKTAPKQGLRLQFCTGGMSDAAARYRAMLEKLLDQIEKLRDNPQALMNIVTQYREVLSAEKPEVTNVARPKIVSRATEPKASSKTSIEKDIARTVTKAVQTHGGPLIKF